MNNNLPISASTLTMIQGITKLEEEICGNLYDIIYVYYVL